MCQVKYESIGSRGKSSGIGKGSSLLFPKAKMFEDFFYDFLFFYDAYDLHDPRAFGTCERINLIYLLDEACPAL